VTVVLKSWPSPENFPDANLHYAEPILRMPRELLILRHAKSDWDGNAQGDFARPLAKRGKKDAPRVGAWMYREGLIPDLVVSSPAERARQTAQAVCKGLDYKRKAVVWEQVIYEATVAELLDLLGRLPAKAKTILLIGHNPGLEELLVYLAGEDLERLDDGKLLPTAALARLEMPNDWSDLAPGCAQLVNITQPKTLRGN
jgi:phosphohistidine phosphatase